MDSASEVQVKFVDACNKLYRVFAPAQKVFTELKGHSKNDVRARIEPFLKALLPDKEKYGWSILQNLKYAIVYGTLFNTDKVTLDVVQGWYSIITTDFKREEMTVVLDETAEKILDTLDDPKTTEFVDNFVKTVQKEVEESTKVFKKIKPLVDSYNDDAGQMKDNILQLVKKLKGAKYQKIFSLLKNDKYADRLVKKMTSLGIPGKIFPAVRDEDSVNTATQRILLNYKYAIDDARDYPEDVDERAVDFLTSYRKFFLEEFDLSSLDVVLDEVDVILDKESKKLAKSAEGPEKSELGMIAFAEERTDDAPFEPDTAREKQLYKSLVAHVDANKPLPEEETDLIKKFLKKDIYSKLFSQPTRANVYRGMSVSKEWLRKALKLKKSEVLKNKGTDEAAFVFTPRRGNASSWSVSLPEAKKFSKDGEGEYTIVIYASMEDNPNAFVDMNKGLYNLKDIESYKKEREVIGLGRLRCWKVSWIRRSWD